MAKKSSYFSNYESPNIVIVPTVNLVVVNKLHDTASIVANAYSATSQQNITNKNSNVSLESRCNNLVNYDGNVAVSEGIIDNLEVDASKHNSILPDFPNVVNITQEIKSPYIKYHSPEDLTSSKPLIAVNETLNKEQLSNTNEETKSIVNDAAKQCMAKNYGFLESFGSDNQPINHPISQTNSLLINRMTSSVKPDKMKEKLKCLNDNDHKKYTNNVIQEKHTSNQQPRCSSSQQPNCSSNNKLKEVCTNKDNDMKKYLKQLWTCRIEKMKDKSGNEKHTNDSAKTISETESSKTSQKMERKNKLVNTEPKHELNKYDTLSEVQKNNLTPGALRRYLDYQRFLQNYHKNLKTKQQVNNDQNKCSNSNSPKKRRETTGNAREFKEKNKELKNKKSSMSIAPSKQKMKELNEHLTKRIESVKDIKKVKRKERKEEANEEATSRIEAKKNKKDSSEKLNNSAERVNTKRKKKEISSYVEHKKNKEDCNEKKNQFEHPMKIKTQSNDGISRKHHVKKERGPNKTEKINNYLARKESEEEPKVIRNKSLKRLLTNVAESSDIKRKNKNVHSALRTTDIRKKLARRNITKNCDDEMDLRSILSRKRTKSQCYGESKRFRASTPPRENLIITVNQDIVPKPLVNKKAGSKPKDKKSNKPKDKKSSKPKDKKSKKIKLVINISCPNTNDSDDSSNECSSPLQDLSFLDDIDIDGIVDSLDVGSSNCESNASTKDVFIPTDLYENTLNKTIIEVTKTDSQHTNLEESKERFLVSAHNPDEKISNHCKKTEHDENLCEDTTTTISPMPINDDVYEVIDITNDAEVIDLSDDQKEDEDTLSTTSEEITEDNDVGSIILINDDSNNGLETPHTLVDTHDFKQNLANVGNSDIVVIKDSVIEDIKSEVPKNNHSNIRNFLKSLMKVEDTIKSKPKLEKLNTTVGQNKEKNKSTNELNQNKDEHHNNSIDTISRDVKMEPHSVLVGKSLGLIEDMIPNDVSPAKNSVDSITTVTNLEYSSDREQLQVAAKNSNEPTNLNKKSCPLNTNDNLIKTEIPSKLDELQADVINITTKAASNEPIALITKSLPVTTNDTRIKTEVTSKINELEPAVLKNNPKIGDSKIASFGPNKLNKKTSQEAAYDKLTKTEAISEINELQPAVMKNDTKVGASKISSNKPGNLNTKSPPAVANNKLIKTEDNSEINQLQRGVINNNIKTGDSQIASIDLLIKTEDNSEINQLQRAVINNNAETGDSQIASIDKLIKTEAISEINNLQPAVTKNNTNSGAIKITSNEPANLNTKTLLEAANDKLIETKAISEINKLHPAVTKNNTNAGASKITSDKPANLNTKSLPIVANDKPHKTEAKTADKNTAPNEPANLNTKTPPVAANVNEIPIEKEVTSKLSELQPAVMKSTNNTKMCASKIASNQPANLNTKTASVAANDKHNKVEASKIDELQAANMKNITKSAVFRIPLNKSTNLNTKIPQATTTAASNSIKTDNTSNIDECQNNNTNNKTISNTVQNVAKKDNTKCKNPMVEMENSAQDEVTSNTQEEDVALTLYLESIEKRMFDYLNQKYTVMSCVHQGYFSNIYQCKGPNGKLYALKVLASRFRSMGIYKDKILTDLQKSVKDKIKYHILEIINNFNFSGEWCFLTEYYPRNLEQALACRISFHIDLVQILSRQLVAAVSTLTTNQIIHADIKPAHILLNSTNNHLKLCGFDRADYNYNIKIIPSFGTSSYRGPEVILGFNANHSIDVWSTALVMHEMATGTKLFPGHYNNDILYKQLCTLGALPFDMVEQSTYAYVHFYGTNFKRQIGNGKWRFEEFRGINNKLRNKLFASYNRDWAPTRTSWEITVDLDKIEMLHRLMERMLVMDPRHRIPISFAAASEFISDSNVYL